MAETGQAIISALWTRITTDATMKSVFDTTVDLYRVMAPQDPAFPYMVHDLQLSSDLFHSTNTYKLDVWTYGPTPLVADAAVNRLKQLLHCWRFSITEAGGLVEWFSGGYIQSDHPQVWHYATQWDVRMTATTDITSIVGG